MMDYLNPKLLADSEMLEDIGRRLRKGDLVVIRDAFIPAFAEYVWRDLARDDVNWVLNEEHVDDGFAFLHHNVYEITDYTPVMREAWSIFDHPETKKWMARLSGRDCSGACISASASRYFPGDHSLPHSDYDGQRSVAFVWHLSKNWDPSWGGALYWIPEPRYRHASFNTLNLLSVTAHSEHFVTTVSRYAQEKRLAFNGWWDASFEPTMEDPLENRYATTADRLTLTCLQSSRILEIDVSTVADPERREGLERLQARLRADQFPEPRSVHVIDPGTAGRV